MTRLTTKLFVVALSAVSLTVAATAAAGGCSSGGGYGGSRGARYPVVRPRVIRTPQTSPFLPAQQPQQFQPPVQQQVQQQQQPRVLGQQPQAPAQTGLNALGNTQQPAANNQQSAEMTALQALAAMGGNQAQTQPAAQPQAEQPAQQPQASTQPQQAAGNVGTWVAKVGDQATVRLDLRADGSFTWTATRNGKTSNFAGQYAINGGKLTLTRSDNQSLAGSMTVNANGFNFKLNGATDNGLNFARG